MTFTKFIAAGVDRGFYGVVDDLTGYLLGGTTTAPVAGNAAGSAMLALTGMVSADPTVAEPAIVDVPGDNGSQGSFIFGPESQPAFTLEKSVFNMVLDAIAQSTKVFTDGQVNYGILQPANPVHPTMCWILQSPTKKKDVGVNGLKAWSGYIIPASEAFPLGRASFSTRAAASDRIRVAATPVSMLFDGMEINDTDFGTTEGPILYFTSDYPIVFHRFTGDAIEDTFVLSHTPAAANQVQVRVNGILKVLTTDYTINLATKELVFGVGDIPANNAAIVVRIGIAA